MKKVLIVHAHPEPQSFCSALQSKAEAWFKAQGAEVKVTDLYRVGFNPVGSKDDFLSLNNPSYFKYQAEQTHASQHDLFCTEVKEEMEKLAWCDTLIFNFPLWWFGLPAILKGWVDRVFAMGFVYGAGKGVYENGVYKDKTAFAVITTGGPAQAYGDTGKNGDLDTILFPIHHGMFYFAGMQVIKPFISFSPVRLSDEERQQELVRFENFLAVIDKAERLY